MLVNNYLYVYVDLSALYSEPNVPFVAQLKFAWEWENDTHFNLERLLRFNLLKTEIFVNFLIYYFCQFYFTFHLICVGFCISKIIYLVYLNCKKSCGCWKGGGDTRGGDRIDAVSEIIEVAVMHSLDSEVAVNARKDILLRVRKSPWRVSMSFPQACQWGYQNWAVPGWQTTGTGSEVRWWLPWSSWRWPSSRGRGQCSRSWSRSG